MAEPQISDSCSDASSTVSGYSDESGLSTASSVSRRKIKKTKTTTLGGSEVSVVRRRRKRRGSAVQKTSLVVDPETWRIVGKGECGIPEMRDAFPDEDNACIFGALQITIGSGKFERTKNVFVHMNGINSGAMKRRAANTKMKEAHDLIGQVHGTVTFDCKDEVTVHNIFEQVGKLFVADNITGAANVFQTTTSIEEIQSNYEREMQKKKEEYLAKQREMMATRVQPVLPKIDRIGEILGLLREDMGWVNWALFKATQKKLVLAHESSFGSGTIFSLRQNLPADKVLFGLLRLSFGEMPFRRTHFVMLHWVGPDVKRVKRGKLNARANVMAKLLEPWNIKLELKGKDDVTVEKIIHKVREIVVVDGHEEDPEELQEQLLIEEFEKALAEEEKANAGKEHTLQADKPVEVVEETLAGATVKGKTTWSQTEITETITLVSQPEGDLNWILLEPLTKKKKKGKKGGKRKKKKGFALGSSKSHTAHF